MKTRNYSKCGCFRQTLKNNEKLQSAQRQSTAESRAVCYRVVTCSILRDHFLHFNFGGGRYLTPKTPASWCLGNSICKFKRATWLITSSLVFTNHHSLRVTCIVIILRNLSLWSHATRCWLHCRPNARDHLGISLWLVWSPRTAFDRHRNSTSIYNCDI